MKKILLIAAIAFTGATMFTSCKKDYTCTCTTVVGGVSNTEKHDISNASYVDAKRTCSNYEDQANENLPGGTTCHL